jgi:hypothetical protein
MQRGKLSQAEAIKKAQFWGALKRSDPSGETVVGPADYADHVAKYDQPRIETDPISGRQVYKGSLQPQAVISGGAVGAPPTMLEYTRNSWIGMRTPVDRFSLNPGADYYVEIPGQAPTMFAGNRDLPIMIGCGADPSVLRWVAWPLRHTAAFSESRSEVTQLIEVSLEGDPEAFHGMASPQGMAGLNDYWARFVTWVQSPPADVGQDIMSPEEIARFYPPGPDGAK